MAKDKYIILENEYDFLLQKEVNKYLSDGWKLAGGVSASALGSGRHFYQAMIKDDEVVE